jgi:uncharacterized protein YgbK (DUF1537 family)
MTRKQVAACLDYAPGYQLDPLVLAKDGGAAARAWLKAQPVDQTKIIYATAEPDAVRATQAELGTDRAGEIVEQVLAQLAIEARDLGTRRFVSAGGETSGAVTKALGVTRMTIGAEIAPGVPWTYCKSGDAEIALTLKSGNFGTPSFFADALAKLEEAA